MNSIETQFDVTPRQWPGLWPGTVVDTDDPDKSGAIRVRVDQVYGAIGEEESIPDASLPWARACFPATGLKTGEAHVPPKGSTVWVSFWGGNAEKPIWLGGWFTPSTIPSEFSGAYESGVPKTKIVKTENGHVFEMKWKSGDEKIRLETQKGSQILLNEKEPKVLVSTPAGFKAEFDEGTQKITIKTPLQTLEIDDSGSKISMDTPGSLQVTVAQDATVTITGNTTLVTTGAVTITAASTVTATVVGAITATCAAATSLISAVSVSVTSALINFTAASINFIGIVTLGKSGPVKYPLLDERFIAAFNLHVHGSAPLVTTPPLIPVVPSGNVTENVTAN